MQNFSGGISNQEFKEANVSTPEQNTELLEEFDINNENEEINTSSNQFNPNKINQIFQNNNEDSNEIEYVMSSMEKLRINHPDSFELVINTTKEIMDIINKKLLIGKDLIKKLDSLYNEIEKMDIDYLFWCSHKCLKVAIIEQHNIDLVHFFIIKKGYTLTNTCIYRNVINEYLKSLSDIDFINGSQEEVPKYVYLLQMLINQGKCDVNDNFDDQVRNSPLHYCIVYKQLQFFIILIKFKYTNINKINLNGDTPLDFATENVIYGNEYYLNKTFAKLLIQHGGKTNNMTHKYNELIKILIEEGDDIGEEAKEKISEKKINAISVKDKKEKKDFSGGSCTISTSSPSKDEDKEDNKEEVENKTVIIGQVKEEKKEDKKDDKKTTAKICTKTISI